MRAKGKAGRELARLGGQVADLLAVLPERLAQWRADRDPARRVIHAGAHPPAPRVALVLVWQPVALAGSLMGTLDHLASQGYAALVVANGGLGQDARDAVLARCWQVLERPNAGHDFGGYRDGIRHLRAAGIAPERLLILNDSIWFPMVAGDDLLTRLDAVQGFSGAAWMERPGRAHAAHMQSYLMVFGPRALAAPAFGRFWEGYLASSRRDSVLKRGEKGLSRAMAAAGLIEPAPASPAGLLDHAVRAEDAELRRALEYAALVDPNARAARQAALDGPAGAFRDAALALLRANLMQGHFLESNPYLAARAAGLHLMKKRRDPLSAEGRAQLRRAVAAGDLPPLLPEVAAELAARDT